MFKTLKNLIKNKEVRKRIYFTLLIFAIYRYGCLLTLPGIDKTAVTISSDSVFSIMNLLGGGALSNFSIFALGVGPYITASIIIQLLSMDVIPAFSDWRNEGEKGRKKSERATRYLGVVLAIIQGFSIVYGFDKQYGILGSGATYRTYIFAVSMLVAGTMLITWLADQITIKGIGNGMSMIIFAGIVAELPSKFFANFSNTVIAAIGTEQLTQGIIHFIGFVLIYLFLIFAVTLVESAERRIHIQNSKATFANGSNNSYLPIKINAAGVIPVIFAQSLITAPQVIVSFFSYSTYSTMSSALSLSTNLGLGLYCFLTFVFTFFYTAMVMNATDMSDNLKKQGSYIPNVRPGKDTENYLKLYIKRTTLIGAIGLTAIAALPYVLAKFATVTSTTALGGTGIIVCVGVAVETIYFLEAMQTEHKYSNGLGFRK
jgi:preprotein translocase subunit SecY